MLGISNDRSARHLTLTNTPRFALAEPAGSQVGAKLAGIGWHPTVTAADLHGLDEKALAATEVLVLACAEHTLLTPAMQSEAQRVGAHLPRLAVIPGAGPEAAAYAARLGWQGFIPAEAAASSIGRAIVALSRGELSFPASATRALVRALARIAPLHDVSSIELTPRQRQIVTLIAEGATDAEIATLLRISRSTAHKHVQNARRRLHAKTRSQLVAASRDLGRTDADPVRALRPVTA
jgi:DNA-binding NarL/FixJ family response regulator